MASLINMELTAAEAKQEVSTEAEAPKYPWGLCIQLDTESMKKLNMTTLPEIGTKMKIVAMVDVSAVRSYASQGGEADTSVDLQVTDMAIDDGSDAMTRAAGTLYGK